MVRPATVWPDRDASLRDYWRARLEQHTGDHYKGRTLAKFPEDLRVYQHIIEESRPEVIVELGTYDGGSAVWFADQLAVLCGGGSVVTVDLTRRLELDDPRVTVLTGDLTSPEIRARVGDLAAGRRVLVTEDSAHTYDTTTAALQTYGDLVSDGGWFVVEDGVVDEPDLSIWPNVAGAQRAVTDFLLTPLGQRFERQPMALYGLTTCHGGWLQARRDRA